MGRAKLSVTISEQTYREIKSFADRKKMKISHLVQEALEEKTKKLKEEELLRQINETFEDPEIAEEQTAMAESIAIATNVEELPW